jgi:hypothetical protein
MARVEFERCDLPVRIAQDEEKLTITVGARLPFGIATVARSVSSDAEPVIDIRDVVRLFQHPQPSAFRWSTPRNPARLDSVFRLTVELGRSDLAGMDWEAIFQPASSLVGRSSDLPSYAPDWTIVRRSPVRPRFETLPLTLPIRVLHLNPRPEHPLQQWVRSLFGTRPDAEVERAVVTAVSDEGSAPDEWATVDVLHVDSLPTAGDLDVLLSTRDPDQSGTLGWFARRTERWQTRLLVLHCETSEDARAGRRFGQALIDKGGPAVLVAFPRDVDGASRVSRFYQSFYGLLIHDSPLDRAVAFAADAPDVRPALFVGAGRAEALRPSNVGMSLVDLWSRLSPGSASWDPTVAVQIRELARHDASPDAVVNDLKADLAATRRKWNRLEFDQHERDGLLPLAAAANQLRSRIPAPVGGVRVRSKVPPVPPPGPRFVNGRFWSEVDGRLEEVEQDRALLRVGSVYQLGLDIGPKDARIVTLNAAALFEDVFKWTETNGVWVEFAVTGIDFEVVGNPIREVWLPREGQTEPVHFAVRPKRAGASHLRYGLYYQHNLIQSFHLVAATSYPDDLVTLATTCGPEDLGLALGVNATLVGDARYIARLEYSRTSALERVSEKHARALSICANQVTDGRAVLTVKGPDHFSESVAVDVDSGMGTIVRDVRKALNEISYAKADGGSLPQFQFGPYASPADLNDRFDNAIVKLASAGWRLFVSLEPDGEKRRKLARLLEGERKVIQIAQLLRKKVVPWGFVYDRPFDDQPVIVGAQVAAKGVCRAAIDIAQSPAAASGVAVSTSGPQPLQPVPLGATTCGAHEHCMLNPQRQAERKAKGLPLYHERSVACPLRFWGFRHVIEVPPQQVEDEDSTGHEETTHIPAGGAVNLVAGLNETLVNCQTHWEDLCSLSAWGEPEYDRSFLLDRLRQQDLDLIYFFCHAHSGGEDPTCTGSPYLEFQRKGEQPGKVRPEDLVDYPPWTHGPLVFLNACGTLGYTPEALSPFLKALVDDRRAAGILGTEVPVAEIMASNVARLFIERFIKGMQAGSALLDVRRELLNNKNPLGLIYTLFAPAELAIVR